MLQVNHFPASFQLGRKDRLWHNLSRMQLRFGRKEFCFSPQTYVLPGDRTLLKNAWDDNQTWIIKPVGCIHVVTGSATGLLFNRFTLQSVIKA